MRPAGWSIFSFLRNWHWLKMRSKLLRYFRQPAGRINIARNEWFNEKNWGRFTWLSTLASFFFPSSYLVVSSTIKFLASKIYFQINVFIFIFWGATHTHTHTHTYINNLFATSNHEFINWNNMCHDRKKSITMISKAKNCFWNNNTPLKVVLKEFQTFIQHFKYVVPFLKSRTG